MQQTEYDLVYKTKTTPFFPIILMAKNYSEPFKSLCGLDLQIEEPIVAVIHDDTAHWFFPKTLAPIGVSVIEQLVSEPALLDNLVEKEQEISKDFLSRINKPVADFFTNGYLNEAGEKELRILFSLYSDYGYYIDVPGFLLQLYYVDSFKERLFASIQGVSDQRKEDIYHTLLSSPYETNYEQFVRALYEHIIEEKDDSNIDTIVENFYWLTHDYLGTIIDRLYVEEQLREMKEKDIAYAAQEIESTQARIQDITESVESLPNDMQQEVRAIHTLLKLYNDRKKEIANQVNIYFRRIVEHRFPEATFNDIHRLYQLAPEDVMSVLKGHTVASQDERYAEWVYEIPKGVVTTGNKELLSLIIPSGTVTELKGSVASPGNITGRVQCILNVSQIQQFEEGNILVAPFTNVNYLPIMKKAKAILTEVGGLTSHAAVVSRELDIPCIVGISQLLSILKDGDAVSVDAKSGVVKILTDE